MEIDKVEEIGYITTVPYFVDLATRPNFIFPPCLVCVKKSILFVIY